MPFRFIFVCDLLERLEEIRGRDPPYLLKEAESRSKEAIKSWFAFHRQRIDNETDGSVLLSTFLPERCSDRVYGLQERNLEKVIGRVLALPNSRRIDLERWRQPGAGDLGDCVERVQKQGEMVTLAQAKEVSIEDINHTLLILASRCRFSSPAIRVYAKDDADRSKDSTSLLGSLYSRLRARESKWLTRLILKTYAPLFLPESFIYRVYHYLLPGLLKIQNNYRAALHLLTSLRNDAPAPQASGIASTLEVRLQNLRPLIGVKVGSQYFMTARSIKNCVDMARNRRMSIEKKYDGEYFQLHINMSKSGRSRIKIFSKSGKDSTTDRAGAHSIIQQCLGLDEPDCEISNICILEGELLVYSDKEKKILDFHEIRKHVTRSGSFLGVHMDSQPHHYEHLMLVFFDILALGDKHVLALKQHERRKILERVIRCDPGRAELAEYQIIRFSSSDAPAKLRDLLTECILARGEGLIIKPADEPYFNFENTRIFQSCSIKLKKGSIANLGDEGDFAVVGATYNAAKAKDYNIPHLQWTDFYIGCLENKDDVLREKAKPRFVVVTIVSLSNRILKALLCSGNVLTSPYGANSHFDLRIEKGTTKGRKPAVIFTNPPVVEIRCFAFDKEGNTGFWTMRFPQVTKLHADRTFLDVVSFQELQQMAERAKAEPQDEAGERLRWIKLLEAADPRGIAVDASTPSTCSSVASGRQKVFLIREDTVERQLQATNSDVMNVHAPSFSSDHVRCVSSSRSSAKSGMESDYRLSPPASAILTSIRNSSRSGKRMQERGSESPIQPSKRQKVTGSFEKTCLHSLAINEPTMTVLKGQRASSRPLLDITSNSSNTPTAPIGGEYLSKTELKTFETTPATTLTERKGCVRPYPTPPDADGSTRGSGAMAPAQDSVLHSGPGTLMETPLNEVSKAAVNFSACQHALASCPFTNCSFLLTPYTGEIPRLIEYLLPSHGANFIRDPQLWLDLERFPKRCAITGNKIRKLVLVEPTKRHETVQIFKAIEKLGLVSGGKREWVEVYDWRLLQGLETAKKMRYDLWRHFWIGAA